jgi:hypothetical protein
MFAWWRESSAYSLKLSTFLDHARQMLTFLRVDPGETIASVKIKNSERELSRTGHKSLAAWDHSKWLDTELGSVER